MKRAVAGVSLLAIAIAGPAFAKDGKPVVDVAATADAAPADAGPDQQDIVITARKLDSARDAILPSLGAGEYIFTRTALDNQPGGADRNLTQVLLQAPGVTLDSYGAIHVRNEHANLQYRLNGVIVPESIAGFGQTFDPRVAENISLITGTLPAQYGYRTSGVVSLTTRTGARRQSDDTHRCVRQWWRYWPVRRQPKHDPAERDAAWQHRQHQLLLLWQLSPE